MLEPFCRQGRDPEGVGAPRDYIEKSGIDRVIVWNIYEVTGNKIAVATLVGQRTDPQTARFIEWFRSQPQ
jgi:hypothetical protein